MDRLWWMHITKAHKFKEDIVNAAAGGRSIVLSLPQNTPWKNTLKELVEDRLRMENPKNRMEEFRCPEEDVGAFLLRKYVRKERRANYRYGMTYAAFLGKCEDTVLNDRYIWVTDVSQKKLEEWLGFIAEYNKKEKQVPLRLPDLKLVITATEYGYKREDGVYVIPIGCLRN